MADVIRQSLKPHNNLVPGEWKFGRVDSSMVFIDRGSRWSQQLKQSEAAV